VARKQPILRACRNKLAFVDELVVEDDPENSLHDSFRSSRVISIDTAELPAAG
jgi:hypothetical protein